MMKKIGILGGSFDPIHFGHLLMAQSAKESLKLDKVLFIPTFCSPFKGGHQLPCSKDRLAMVKAAIKGNDGFSIYTGELRREGVSYTIDTLKELTKRYPQSKFYLLMGADNLKSFHRWKDAPGILKLATLVVLNRPGFDKSTPKRYPHQKINMPAVDISSSDIRQRLRTRKSIWYLTPKNVIRYISRHKLYS